MMQAHGREGAGFRYGQGYGGADQQLPFNVQDPRYQAPGGHYIQNWQNPGQGPNW
jgi:hypothetical protein